MGAELALVQEAQHWPGGMTVSSWTRPVFRSEGAAGRLEGSGMDAWGGGGREGMVTWGARRGVRVGCTRWSGLQLAVPRGCQLALLGRPLGVAKPGCDVWGPSGGR